MSRHFKELGGKLHRNNACGTRKPETGEYQTYHSKEELFDAYLNKFQQVVEMFKTKGLSAAVYTQTSDVESEVNGLMTCDREYIKFPVDKMKELHKELYEQP